MKFIFILSLLLFTKLVSAQNIISNLNLTGNNNPPSIVIREELIKQFGDDIIIVDDQFNKKLTRQYIKEFAENDGKYVINSFGTPTSLEILELMKEYPNLLLIAPVTGHVGLFDNTSPLYRRIYNLRISYKQELYTMLDYFDLTKDNHENFCFFLSGSSFGQSIISYYNDYLVEKNVEGFILDLNYHIFKTETFENEFNYIGPYGFYDFKMKSYYNAISSFKEWGKCKIYILFGGEVANIDAYLNLSMKLDNVTFVFNSLVDLDTLVSEIKFSKSNSKVFRFELFEGHSYLTEAILGAGIIKELIKNPNKLKFNINGMVLDFTESNSGVSNSKLIQIK